MWNWFFGCNVFLELVSIWYQDLRSGYAHVKFQPDCSKGVDSTAFGRFETFSALAILCLRGSPSNFVCSNAWAPRSFWQILSQSTFSEAEIWPKMCFSPFFSTKLEITIDYKQVWECPKSFKKHLDACWVHILTIKAQKGSQNRQWTVPVSLSYSSNMALLDDTYCHFG